MPKKIDGITGFNLGMTVTTSGVADLMNEDPEFCRFVGTSLKRHSQCDWGDICEEDWKENEFALQRNLRLFSSYNHKVNKIWIITESDHSVTTILFPEEY